MRISHGTRVVNIEGVNGYGYATLKMIESLTKLGHEVSPNDPDADVQIWFDQPQHWKWNDSDQYRIGYHPWESTRLQPGWANIMNKVDEIWTPSPIVAQWYAKAGIKKPIYVYEHGVEKDWHGGPVREVKDKFMFLHIGAEAARKGGMEIMRSFRKAFPNRDDVGLTMKMINEGWNIPGYGGVTILNEKLSVPDLIALHRSHHAFVYPSWGEGFGLTPLQAMATGMPTITLPAWAPYARFLDDRLNIKSVLTGSPWPRLHPGRMFRPTIDDVIDKMRWVVDNYDSAQEYAQSQIEPLTEHYDWDRLTAEAFGALENRLEKKSENLSPANTSVV